MIRPHPRIDALSILADFIQTYGPNLGVFRDAPGRGQKVHDAALLHLELDAAFDRAHLTPDEEHRLDWLSRWRADAQMWAQGRGDIGPSGAPGSVPTPA